MEGRRKLTSSWFSSDGGLGRPETPVKRLYLCSSAIHPGGGVHGAPGAAGARAALGWDRARRVASIAVPVSLGIAGAAAKLRSGR